MGIYYIRHAMIEPNLSYSTKHTIYKLERIVDADPILNNEKNIEIEFITYDLKTDNVVTSVFFLDLFLRTQLQGNDNLLIFDNPFDICADAQRGLRNAVAYSNFLLYPQISSVFFTDFSPFPYSRYAEELFLKLEMRYSPLGDARNPIQEYCVETVKIMKQLREERSMIYLGHDCNSRYRYMDESKQYVSTNAIAEYLNYPEKSIRKIVQDNTGVKKIGGVPLSTEQKALLKDAMEKDYCRQKAYLNLSIDKIRFRIQKEGSRPICLVPIK